MKKIAVCFLPFLLVGCKTQISYRTVLDKMKSYEGTVVMDNDNIGGSYSEEGFFTRNGEIVLYINSRFTSDIYLFVTIPNSTYPPSVYSCLYSSEDNDPNFSCVGSFYVPNYYNRSSSVNFDTYKGYAEMKDSEQKLAKSCLNLLLSTLDLWVYNELNTFIKDVGMFPNY